jgi:hypothetical protein
MNDIVSKNNTGINEMVKSESKSMDDRKIQGFQTCLDHVKKQGKFDTSDDVTVKCDIDMSLDMQNCDKQPKPLPLVELRICDNPSLKEFFKLRNNTLSK